MVSPWHVVPTSVEVKCGSLCSGANHDHRHSGIGLLPPAVVHAGQASAATEARQQVLTVAYTTHLERFPRGVPCPPQVPTAVWINRPHEPVGPTITAPGASNSFLNHP